MQSAVVDATRPAKMFSFNGFGRPNFLQQ